METVQMVYYMFYMHIINICLQHKLSIYYIFTKSLDGSYTMGGCTPSESIIICGPPCGERGTGADAGGYTVLGRCNGTSGVNSAGSGKSSPAQGKAQKTTAQKTKAQKTTPFKSGKHAVNRAKALVSEIQIWQE